MTAIDRDALDRLLPPTADPGDWDDVIIRSRTLARSHRRRLVALAAVALLVAAVSASAFGTARAAYTSLKDQAVELFVRRDSSATAANAKIAYIHNPRMNARGPDELWVVNADGTGHRRLARNAICCADWSRDGRMLAYLSEAGFQIHVVNADGSGRRQLTKGPGANRSPAWSPDGRTIAFVRNRDFVGNRDDGNWDVYAIAANGGEPRNLTRSAVDEFGPVWSPGGRRIAFLSNRDGNLDIFVMNADGSGVRNLTRSAKDEYNAIWSNDGRRIGYVSSPGSTNRPQGDHASSFELFVVNVDGSGRQRLTRSAVTGGGPSWSPDGRRIAFTRRTGSGPVADVYVMNADGSEQRNLNVRVNTDGGLAWSPDGRTIAFTLDGEIAVVRPDGTGLRRLTRTPTANWFEAWSPGTDVEVFFPVGMISRSAGDVRFSLSVPRTNPQWGERPDRGFPGPVDHRQPRHQEEPGERPVRRGHDLLDRPPRRWTRFSLCAPKP